MKLLLVLEGGKLGKHEKQVLDSLGEWLSDREDDRPAVIHLPEGMKLRAFNIDDTPADELPEIHVKYVDEDES